MAEVAVVVGDDSVVAGHLLLSLPRLWFCRFIIRSFVFLFLIFIYFPLSMPSQIFPNYTVVHAPQLIARLQPRI